MTYDDSEKALARGTAIRSFKCLLCGSPMEDAGKQWERRCGFLYKPLVIGAIPKKYRNDFKQIKRMYDRSGQKSRQGKEMPDRSERES